MRVYTKVKGERILNYLLTNNISIHKDTLDFNDKTPIVFRGMARSPLIKQCVDNNIDFYYIDTGYINDKIKIWHRFTKNNFQVLNHLSYDELTQRTNINKLKNRFFEIVKKNYNSFKPELRKKGDKILITPPTNKVFKHFNYDVDKWISETVEKIKKFTDKEIIVRQKPRSRQVRIYKDKFLDQLKKDDVHCVVTFSSIVSIEAILNGYPVITLGPNAASYLSESKIENIDNPYFPDDDKIKEHILIPDVILLENQPVLKNPTMKSMQMFLFSYYLIRNMDISWVRVSANSSNVAEEIKKVDTVKKAETKHQSHPLCYTASKKLDLIKFLPDDEQQRITSIIDNVKNNYQKNKKLAILIVEYLLKNNSKWLSFFNTHTKQDDLSDSLLMTLHYYMRSSLSKLSNANNISSKKKKKPLETTSVLEPELALEPVLD